MPAERSSLRIRQKNESKVPPTSSNVPSPPPNDKDYFPNGDELLFAAGDQDGEETFDEYVKDQLRREFTSNNGQGAVRMVTHALNSPLTVDDNVDESVHRQEKEFLHQCHEKGIFSKGNFKVEHVLLDRLVLHGLRSFESLFSLISRTDTMARPSTT